jgi:hypothetical protein
MIIGLLILILIAIMFGGEAVIALFCWAVVIGLGLVALALLILAF